MSLFPEGIDTLILKYSLDNPLECLATECINGNKELVIWLQKNYRFHKTVSKSVLEKLYNTKICLSNSIITSWYIHTFKIIYNNFTCMMTTIKNKSENYKKYLTRVIEYTESDSDQKSKDSTYMIIFTTIVCHGTLEMLKFIVDEKKIPMPEIHISGCPINDPLMMEYIYDRLSGEAYKDELSNSSIGLSKQICETNDIKLVVNYYEKYGHIVKRKINGYDDDYEGFTLNLIINSVVSKEQPPPNNPAYWKWVDPEIIIYIFNKFPIDSEHIREEKDRIIQYLKLSKSKELLQIIEKHIGSELIFF